MCKGLAKADQHIVNLRWPDSDVFAKRNIDASADNEVKRIVQPAETQFAYKSPQKLLCDRSPEFYDGANVVGEEISLSVCSASIPNAIWWRYCKVVRIAAVALKLCHNSDVLAEVKSA